MSKIIQITLVVFSIDLYFSIWKNKPSLSEYFFCVFGVVVSFVVAFAVVAFAVVTFVVGVVVDVVVGIDFSN
jgi:hypothetical protein